MIHLTPIYRVMKAHRFRRLSAAGLLTTLLLLCDVAQAASIKCWTNSEGHRECGQTVPPEYSQQRIDIINERGIVIEVDEAAKTKEQLAEETRQKELLKEQQRREAEQKRRDSVLLNTFSTERDINIAKSRRVDAIVSIIDITNNNTKSLKGNLGEVQKKAADYERAGETPPQELLNEMATIKRQINDNDEFVAKKKKDIDALNKRFEADMKRFRELKGIKPPEKAHEVKKAAGKS
ncbi:MAG: hypothetical protein LJE74_03980 [Proteobacteria bacterium]|nr:hypothetical protein [Pseudomonadota bacterium]